MQPLHNRRGARLWFSRIERPYSFAPPPDIGGFALLLVVGDEDVTPEEQSDLSEQFVRSGCRFAACAGVRCSTWDDSIDMVGVMDQVDGKEAPFVMTTWHEDQSLQDLAEYFARDMAYDDWRAENFVALVVGGPPELARRVRSALLRAFAADA